MLSSYKQLLVKAGDGVETNQPLIILESSASYETIFLLANKLNTFQLSDVDIWHTPHQNLGEIQAEYNMFQEVLLNYALLLNNNQLSLNKKNAQELINKYLALDSEYKIKLETATELTHLQIKRLEAYNSLINKGGVPSNQIILIKQEMLQLKSNIENIRITRKNNELLLIKIKQSISNEALAHQNEVAKIENQIHTLRLALINSINQWKKNYIIIAPTSGVISFTKRWSLNQYLKEGQDVLTISPNHFIIEGEMKISGRGVGKIVKNQKVYINLDSFPANQFGQLKGTITGVSLIPDQQGYLVTVALPEQLKTTYNYNIALAPMYEGQAKIILDERSLLSRLFDSVSYLLQKDSGD